MPIVRSRWALWVVAILVAGVLVSGGFMAYYALQEASLREDVIRAVYESTVGDYKGFEAYLLRDAVSEAERSPTTVARARLHTALAALARREPAPDSEERQLNRMDDGAPFLWEERTFEPRPGESCYVLELVPSFLTPAIPGEPLAADVADDIRFGRDHDAGLCHLLHAKSFRDDRTHPRQAYHVSSRGVLRLVRTTAEQSARQRVVPSSEEMASLARTNLADRSLFQRCEEQVGEIRSSPPYVDVTGFGIVSSDGIVTPHGRRGLALFAVDVELFETEEYLRSIRLGAAGFLGSVEASFVDCGRRIDGPGVTAVVCRRAGAHPGAPSRIDRLKSAGGSLVFTVPVGPSRFAAYEIDADRLSWTGRLLFGLLAFVGLVLAVLLGTLIYFRRKTLEAQEIFANVQENMPGGLAILDGDQRIVFSNAFLRRLAGRDRLEGLRLPADILDGDSGRDLIQLADSSERFDLPVSVRRPEGELVPALATVARIRHGGQPGRMAVVLPLEKLGPVIASRFVNDFAHALKTPAHALVALAEGLADGSLGPEKTRRYREMLESAAGRFKEMVNNFLSFPALDLGLRTRDPVAVSLVRELSRVLRPFEIRAREKKLDLRHSRPRRLRLRVEKAAFELIMSNLLENALKYTEHGKIYVDVREAEDAHGRPAAEILVRDSGIGIPADEKDQVFDRFFRGRSLTVQSQDGVGLGLYLVRRQVQLVGGSIDVDSEPGRGTTFRVVLPDGAGLPTGGKVDEAEDDEPCTEENPPG